MTYHDNGSWRRPLTALVITSITVTSSYCLYQLVSEYGWEGTWWYIWEGDPHPPQVRDEFHTLDRVESSIAREARILDRLEEAYERALLNSVDGSSGGTIAELWNANLPKRNLDRLIGLVSHNLDGLAATVDAVPSQKHRDLRARKKQLSNQIVQQMLRADVFVGHYQNGQKKS